MHRDDLTLTTARLVLRPVRLEDFDAWAEMMADEETARFIGGAQARPAVWRGFMCMAGAWCTTGIAMFSVIEKASGRWIGRVGPWRPEAWPGTEVGWAIAREFCGLGYATEAAAASMDYAFETLGWTEVIHCIDPLNLPSQGVARKLGSRNRGRGRMPPPFDNAEIDIWGQSREEWLAARPRLKLG